MLNCIGAPPAELGTARSPGGPVGRGPGRNSDSCDSARRVVTRPGRGPPGGLVRPLPYPDGDS
eukprot:564759-Hanusia_phi.AAC.1